MTLEIFAVPWKSSRLRWLDFPAVCSRIVTYFAGGVHRGALWKSLRTSYPPGGVEVFERETVEGDGFVLGTEEGKMIVVAEAVGKWESRWVCGISKRSGKPVFGFPRSGFPTAFSPAASRQLECAGHDGRSLFRFGA